MLDRGRLINQVERLVMIVSQSIPRPRRGDRRRADHRGSWFLDVPREGAAPPLVVEWRPDRGFGVSSPDADDYGTGPDASSYLNEKAAFNRLVRLILSGGRTEPPRKAQSGSAERPR